MQVSAAHRSLAARVIGQAIRDVRDPNGARINSASARSFLSGSPMLSYWCEIADIDVTCVIDRARTLLLTATLASATAPAPPKSTETRGAQQSAVVIRRLTRDPFLMGGPSWPRVYA